MSSKTSAYEKLGAFYLGRPHDPATGETAPAPLLYDSKDLTTHGVCVGMTGSGKTGLCVSLIEEAALDGIPALVIDVKGDLGNLLFTFPELRGEDFRPFIDTGAATRKGLEPDEFAAQQAELWKKGLAGWDQSGDRIRRLREAADFSIYTPGSEAGLPISILSSFGAPPAEVVADNDLLQERIATTSASLLGLLGVDADPIRSREAILLSNLLHHAWNEGRDLDLGALIQGIQDPPMERVGVMPLESFYPGKERFELAMSLNNLLASPTFQSWMSGEPLDIDRMLYTAAGKPRVSIFSIAHLSDAERMFFVSLLLNQSLGWMRSRSGTSSLRALLYMDEIFGYLPPSANPPSKKPMLTLLKQARAFGFGLLLATQNPVDLDYKALSNIGTWFLGRLQTERDKERVIEGLLGAAGGEGMSRKEIERTLSGVGKRVFLLHNVHEDAPVLFKVRWAMSYLRGPLTRQEIKRLMADRAAGPAVEEAAEAAPAKPAPAARSAAAARPVLPPGIRERFLPLRGRRGAGLVYRPHLLGLAKVHFVDSRKGLEASQEIGLLVPLEDNAASIDWYEAQEVSLVDDDLESDPLDGAIFAELPAGAADTRRYTTWKNGFADTLYRTRRFELLRSTTFKLISKPGESDRDFRIRLADVAHEERDEELEKLRKRYAKKMETLEDRIRRAEQKVEREREQAQQVKMQSVVNLGTTLLGALMGRRKFSATSVRRAGSVFRGMGRSSKERRDVELAEENVLALEEQLQDLNSELESEVDELAERFAQEMEELETYQLKPRKTDIDVRLFALAWAPYREADGGLEAAWE